MSGVGFSRDGNNQMKGNRWKADHIKSSHFKSTRKHLKPGEEGEGSLHFSHDRASDQEMEAEMERYRKNKKRLARIQALLVVAILGFLSFLLWKWVS